MDLVEFTAVRTGEKLYINPAMVTFYKVSIDRDSKVMIVFAKDHAIVVEETLEETKNLLSHGYKTAKKIPLMKKIN